MKTLLKSNLFTGLYNFPLLENLSHSGAFIGVNTLFDMHIFPLMSCQLAIIIYNLDKFIQAVVSMNTSCLKKERKKESKINTQKNIVNSCLY